MRALKSKTKIQINQNINPQRVRWSFGPLGLQGYLRLLFLWCSSLDLPGHTLYFPFMTMWTTHFQSWPFHPSGGIFCHCSQLYSISWTLFLFERALILKLNYNISISAHHLLSFQLSPQFSENTDPFSFSRAWLQTSFFMSVGLSCLHFLLKALRFSPFSHVLGDVLDFLTNHH